MKWVVGATWEPCCGDYVGLAACLCSDWRSRTPQIEWPKQTFISCSLPAEKSEVKVLADSAPGQVLFLACRQPPSHFALISSSSFKDTRPILRPLPSGPRVTLITPQRPHLQIPSHQEGENRASAYDSIIPCVLTTVLCT